MRKIFFSAVLSIIVFNVKANKTDSLGHSSKLFVNIGINQSTLFNNDLFNKSVFGLEMGASVLTHWQNHWYSEIGLQYIRKGASRDIDYVNIANNKLNSYTENVYLHYVQLPIVLKKYLPLKKKDTYLTLGIGVYNALLFSAWVNPQHIDLNHEQVKIYHTYDAGLIGSLGIIYKNKIGLQARYEQGLLNVSKANEGINNTFAVGLTFWLGNLKFMLER